MVTNDGDTEGLFRAAYMQSGSALAMGDISQGQVYYDALVAETGCSGARDTLQCLREVPYANFTAAVNLSPGIFAYQVCVAYCGGRCDLLSNTVSQSLREAWVPRADGVFLKDDPQKLVLEGSVAKVPFITGVCERFLEAVCTTTMPKSSTPFRRSS